MTFLISKKTANLPHTGGKLVYIARGKLEQLSVCYKNVNTKADNVILFYETKQCLTIMTSLINAETNIALIELGASWLIQ